MATTTIRLEDDLKQRVASAALRAGKTPHAFIVEAVARSVEQAEIDAEFEARADERWSALLATGQAVPGAIAREWLEARARGEAPPRPAPQPLPERIASGLPDKR